MNVISQLIGVFACVCCVTSASLSTTEQFSLLVGDTLINITRETFPSPSFSSSSNDEKGLNNIKLAFLNLHENENTSVVSARSYMLYFGGSLVKFSNKHSRLVDFSLDSNHYSVDPNRMFTPEGIEASLKQYSTYTPEAAAEVSKLAEYVLDIYEFDEQSTVLALHDNGGTYGANSYLPGQTYENDAAAVNIVDGTNPSDFYYVVDPAFYTSLKNASYNVVLQNNETVTNDGSLSYYSGVKGKAYINFEAQAEYTATGAQVVIQLDMINAVRRMLTEMN